ncbi:putative cellulose-binding family ii protein [Eutypa lata UCREL1]|uniref:Putative cellulose-binding family ii protein n=1 Tax=Eutypa lata (strain UCR-EL1) TaxID=1287681 RepID=M7T6M2_EUTLA|nr:putative cellulose-binding family ii protein [Eutypa lata UCREL1]
MKTTTALSALAALGNIAQAHPSPGPSEATNLQARTCNKPDRRNVVRNTNHLKTKATTSDAITTTAAAEWEPPSNLSTALDEVWEHEMETYSAPLEFLNWGYGKWVDLALVGFDGFPHAGVNVTVVGWAATGASLLLEGDGTGDGVPVYTDTRDADGIPECDPACGRAVHYADGDYSGCAGGVAARYDVSLWLSESLNGNLAGYGGDWGQQLPTDYMLANAEADNIHILLHEMGHTLALDDFYDWTPDGVAGFIMDAGSAMEITEFDAWMARDWWRHLKSRYDL